MRLQLVSICLFLLFCLVIVFPGYGKPRIASTSRNEAIVKSATHQSVYSLVLRCLSSGINMVEEERNSEQEDDDHAADEVFVPSYTCPVITRVSMLTTFRVCVPYGEQPSHTDIFSPPDLQVSFHITR